MELGAVIMFLAFLLVAAPFVSNVTKIPITVIEIALGVFGAYVGLLRDLLFFDLLAHVGFLYLMFLVGMEVNLKEFSFSKKGIFKRAALFFVTLYVLSVGVTLYCGLSLIYIAIFPIFSLGILMTLVKEYGKREAWLSTALAIGVIGELLSIVVVIILNSSLKTGVNEQFFFTLAALVGFLVIFVCLFKFAKVLFWWFPELKIVMMPYHDNRDIDIRLSMAMLFAMIAVMMVLGIDQVLGAFLAGLFLTSFFGHKRDLPEKLNSFGFGFFVPLFFIHVGSTLPLSAFTDSAVLELALFIMAVLVLIRLAGSFVAFFDYFGFKNTLLFSLSNSIPLTFLVAIGTLAHNAHAISDTEYYAIVVASMISAVALILIIKLLHQQFRVRPRAGRERR
jgi:Kef-type K+ transport system membrane component KefB